MASVDKREKDLMKVEKAQKALTKAQKKYDKLQKKNTKSNSLESFMVIAATVGIVALAVAAAFVGTSSDTEA